MVAPTSGGNCGAGTQAILEEITKQMTETIKNMLAEARAEPDTEGGPTAAYGNLKRNDPLVGIIRNMMV